MTLADFQTAIVDLILSPQSARLLLDGDDRVLRRYRLTERERERLRSIVGQPGMSLCCTLARANRFEPIAEVFPMTCVLLEPVLRELLDDVWGRNPLSNYQFAGDDVLFADCVRKGIKSRELSGEYLEEIFQYEEVCWQLAQQLRRQPIGPGRREAVVEFRHAPEQLLPPLSRLTAPPPSLPTGTYRVRIRLDRSRHFGVDVIAEA